MSITHAPELDGELAVTVLRCGRAAMGWIGGSVDTATASRLRAELRRTVSSGIDHLIIDLGDVTHFGPAGVAVLIDLRDCLAPLGALTIQRPSWAVVDCLDRHGMRTLVDEPEHLAAE